MKNSLKKTILAIVLAGTASFAYAQTCTSHTVCSGGRCATIVTCHPF
jgi:hypothetical protein|tara:strand:+ start:205 stop:345 length:141 start_codon:yes stop_codon:yes gene_type:complete